MPTLYFKEFVIEDRINKWAFMFIVVSTGVSITGGLSYLLYKYVILNDSEQITDEN